jgi:hypothetical protein
VIGTILMIMIVMIGMSILFGALIVYSDNFRSGRGSSVLESITIEHVQFTSPNTAKLWLYNTGQIDLEVSNIYVNGQMATLQITPLTNTVLIEQGKHYDALTVNGVNFKVGTNDFKIVTIRGTGFEGAYVYG